jgi:hypothetical protein
VSIKTRGRPLHEVSAVGHSSVVTSQRYVHPTPKNMEQAVTRLEEYNRKQHEELIANMRVQ